MNRMLTTSFMQDGLDGKRIGRIQVELRCINRHFATEAQSGCLSPKDNSRQHQDND